jgi:hypothetical protein
LPAPVIDLEGLLRVEKVGVEEVVHRTNVYQRAAQARPEADRRAAVGSDPGPSGSDRVHSTDNMPPST